MQYRLGVLGGMGPQATNTFYQFVIDRTDAQSDQEHVNALILSDVDMPVCWPTPVCWRGRGAPVSLSLATLHTSFWTGSRSKSAFPLST